MAVRMQSRADRMDAGLMQPVQTGEGFAWFEARCARPGIMLYSNADGTMRRELVPEETLHDTRSLGTLGGKPVTLSHPSSSVTPESFSRDAVGHIGETVVVEEQGGFVQVRLMINRADALDAIASGKVEVSPGYKAIVDDEPGTHPVYGDYDTMQVWRGPYNHLAIVDQARGGAEVRIRVDGVEHREDCPWTPVQETIDTIDTIETPEFGMNKTSFLALIAACVPGIASDKADSLADTLIVATAKDGEDKPAIDSAAFEAMQKENADLKQKIADMEGEEEEEKGDAMGLAARIAWAADRADLTAHAEGLELTIADDATNDAIRRQIVESAYDVTDADDTMVRALWVVRQSTPAPAPVSDVADAAGFRTALRRDTDASTRAVSVADAAESALADQIDRYHIAHPA